MEVLAVLRHGRAFVECFRTGAAVNCRAKPYPVAGLVVLTGDKAMLVKLWSRRVAVLFVPPAPGVLGGWEVHDSDVFVDTIELACVL